MDTTTVKVGCHPNTSRAHPGQCVPEGFEGEPEAVPIGHTAATVTCDGFREVTRDTSDPEAVLHGMAVAVSGLLDASYPLQPLV